MAPQLSGEITSLPRGPEQGARRRDARDLPRHPGGAETRRPDSRVAAGSRPRAITGAIGTPGAFVLENAGPRRRRRHARGHAPQNYAAILRPLLSHFLLTCPFEGR